MSSTTLSELVDALDHGALLLLPNARAARDLRSAYDTRQKGRGLPAWEPARALSWSQWANSLWSELIIRGREARLLLNAAQEHSIWRQIIADDPTHRSIGSLNSVAELARSAWQLAADHEATSKLRSFATSYDSKIFAAWADAFTKQCTERGYVSTAGLNAALSEHVRLGNLRMEGSLELVGFGSTLPSQQTLLAQLRGRGTLIVERTLKALDSRRLVESVVAPTLPDEYLFAMQWIRKFLEARRSGEHATRIALLVPNLAEERAQLESMLREVLTPELQSIEADLSSTPWEFSDGISVSSATVILDALELIRWTQGALSTTRVSSLLLSPYFGNNGTDALARDASARFDAHLLRRLPLLRSEIEIPALLEAGQRSAGTSNCSSTFLSWLRAVQEFLKGSGDQKRPRSVAEWMELVRGVLVAANWPGNRALTAVEFEATGAWESVLDLVSTLDFSGRRVTFTHALEALEFHAKAAKLLTPSMDATVQVMSVAEAEGSTFDAVLFLHATDANLPVAEDAHPLLPWALQRSLKMPGGDPSTALSKCRAGTERLLESSSAVLFSYAAEDQNGVIRPSPILSELKLQSIHVAQMDLPVQPFHQVASEIVADEDELPPLPSNEVGGGASVLKLQAACGFLAFAELRLRARELKHGGLGLDAGESGTLLHRVLQTFWRETQTQEALRLMSWNQREETLMRAINDALPSHLRSENQWDRAYLSLFKQRLQSVLQQWLDQELLRGPFTVSDVERRELVTVGPLTMEIRVDRVDVVENGLFFVDYKTGADVDPKQWSGPRPDDPQLPLYTLLAETEELKGVAFAKVRAGREMKWQGYQAEEGFLPRSRSKNNVRNLAALAMEWRAVLTRLAEDFAAGRADVHPKSVELNCTRCAQRVLCRIDPTSLRISADENSEEPEDGIE